MTDGWVATRGDVDGFVAEDDVLGDARAHAVRVGCRPVAPAVGAALRFLATAISARAVVEIGTGTGVSGLWLLRGMVPDGTLTSIDVDPEHQRAARAAFVAGGNGPARLRLINGMGLEVLPRLTDGGYDLVFVDATPNDHPRYLDESLRLLRTGGIVAINGVTPDGGSTAGQPAGAAQDVARQVRADDRLAPVLLPLGDGLLAAVKRS
ncbi:O-methyltransferase [Pseudonocardia sp. CA-107938]|uniref:O-methyltransferase n=1 Tax=Pseudonocardia sp. CA-107938 TaxID=3240021 RepID=UPI003D93AD4E